ncbi:MAG: tRNA pseudouridine(38-40) synthase TruA [Desulfovibrionaceae bacterium]|nr:tRNA pseudouridine(38-40) synthase TruA [Desulfovibrionaceae bacterium]
MPRLKLTLAYQGARYAGWQLQVRPDKALPTIQGELESRVARIVGERIPIHGAGRTDSGVHAEGQVCHLDLPAGSERIDWQQALNMQLPHDIRITEASWVAEDFHARRSALGKRYAYSLWMSQDRALPRIAPFVWSTPVPALDPIIQALPLLTGQRDFATFQNSGTTIANTVRTLHSITVDPGTVAGLICPPHWPVVTLVFAGNGFLKQMVRNLMGLLVWIAQGKLRADAIPALLEARKRRALPSPAAPAQGLSLMEVLY